MPFLLIKVIGGFDLGCSDLVSKLMFLLSNAYLMFDNITPNAIARLTRLL